MDKQEALDRINKLKDELAELNYFVQEIEKPKALSKKELVKMLQEGKVGDFNNYKKYYSNMVINLSYSDLSNLDLSFANLTNMLLNNINFSNTKFHNANISGSNLSNCNLEGSDFRYCAMKYSTVPVGNINKIIC